MGERELLQECYAPVKTFWVDVPLKPSGHMKPPNLAMRVGHIALGRV